MAVAHVTLSPYLQAWSAAGVSHVLFEQPVQIAAVLAAQKSMPTMDGGAATVPAAAVRQVPHTGLQTLARVSKMQPTADVVGRTFASREGLSEQAAVWTPAWSLFREKAIQAPIVWTYHELGADLSGTGRSTERSAFFRQIIAELQLRKGSSSFWPCALPFVGADGVISFEASPAYFAAGIDLLAPRLVVVFGRRALSDIGLDDGIPYFTHILVEGKLIVFLPEVSDLLQGVAQRASSVSLLRAVVATLSFQ